MNFLNPEAILPQIGIFQPGMKVGDFGCGAGYNTFVLARLVGEEGEVVAVDILQERIQLVDRKSKQLGLTNVKSIRANLEAPGGTSIPPQSLHAVLLATVLFQSDQKEAMIEEAKRALKPGGFLIIIDWHPDAPLGPKGYKVSKDEVVRIVSRAGFAMNKEFPVDAYHYGLVFTS